MKELHEVKVHILKKLLYSDFKRYSEIKPREIEGSQFMFHLNDLIDQALVIKNSDGNYSLTLVGKNFAGKYDYDSKLPSTQAKHSVVICAFRHNRSEVLLYTRLKNPFYGCQGFMTGKVQYGEEVNKTAKREFHEETNLTGSPELTAIRHYRVYDKSSKKLLEDKVMYIHIVDNPKGRLLSNDEGEFKWINIDKVEKFISNPLEEFWEIYTIAISVNTKEWFKEVDHFTSKF